MHDSRSVSQRADVELEQLPLIYPAETSSADDAAQASRKTTQPAPTSGVQKLRQFISHDPLLFYTLLGVACGVILGTALYFANLSSLALEFIGLPGDIMMRLLKMLVLPLVTISIMAGVCSLQKSTADMGKVARDTLLYYACTTMGAVILGIILVYVVQPGRGEPFNSGKEGNCHSKAVDNVTHGGTTPKNPTAAILNVVRSAFPDNIVVAAAQMNILGVITVSLLFGIAFATMGPKATPMVELIDIVNEAVGKIVTWVIWMSPVGIASLIIKSICSACQLGPSLKALGLFMVTVLIGLTIWGFIVLPLLYWSLTKRQPLAVYRAFAQAMATAFGTDSSNATLPITMRNAREIGCDDSIIQFFLPLGTTVNMNGTALYEAVTVIFIAQAHGVQLGGAGTVIVALTATLAAVGAAGIPSAGLVTMLMVLQAVGLIEYASDIAVILTVDWFLDRCRTVVNVLGDAFGTVIVDHFNKQRAVTMA